jgi:succinate dehydrogenase / fumarate reductase, cytochrome b subunit
MAYGKYSGFKGLFYKAGGPYHSFSLHRLTAMAIILFVGTHVAASFSMQQGLGTWGTTINVLYESWWFQIFIVFCVLFHTINGVRVVILDIWPKLIKYSREAVYLEWAIFIPIYILTVFLIVTNAINVSI